MTRREEIEKYIHKNRPMEENLLSPLVDDVVFLEKRLDELRELPFIEIHPSDKTKQRMTSAGKQYKELLQQYNNCLKIIILKVTEDGSEKESPLRTYMNNRIKKVEK